MSADSPCAEGECLFQHSSEPWGIFSNRTCIAGSDGRGVASFAMAVRTPDERMANAARAVACVNACSGIKNPAAVPDLLAACRMAHDRLVYAARISDEIRERLNAAIAKAEGRS